MQHLWCVLACCWFLASAARAATNNQLFRVFYLRLYLLQLAIRHCGHNLLMWVNTEYYFRHPSTPPYPAPLYSVSQWRIIEPPTSPRLARPWLKYLHTNRSLLRFQQSIQSYVTWIITRGGEVLCASIIINVKRNHGCIGGIFRLVEFCRGLWWHAEGGYVRKDRGGFECRRHTRHHPVYRHTGRCGGVGRGTSQQQRQRRWLRVHRMWWRLLFVWRQLLLWYLLWLLLLLKAKYGTN